MDIKKLIEIVTDEPNEVVYDTVKDIIEKGNVELIKKTFKKYEDAISEYSDNERAEEDFENGDMSYGLDLYKGITKFILAIGKGLAVNNFQVIDDAYELDEFSQGYVDDYKFFVESYLEDDDREIEEMNNIFDELKSVFDDADFED